jgi:hypothetical protein
MVIKSMTCVFLSLVNIEKRQRLTAVIRRYHNFAPFVRQLSP